MTANKIHTVTKCQTYYRTTSDDWQPMIRWADPWRLTPSHSREEIQDSHQCWLTAKQPTNSFFSSAAADPTTTSGLSGNANADGGKATTCRMEARQRRMPNGGMNDWQPMQWIDWQSIDSWQILFSLRQPRIQQQQRQCCRRSNNNVTMVGDTDTAKAAMTANCSQHKIHNKYEWQPATTMDRKWDYGWIW